MRFPTTTLLVLVVGAVPSWSQAIGEDCIALNPEFLDSDSDECELDFIGRLECSASGGAGEGRSYSYDDPDSSSDVCEIFRYQFCPAISECYKGCAEREAQEDTYQSCISAATLTFLNDTVQMGACKLDCANFDHTAGVPFSELTDYEATDDDDVEIEIAKACGALEDLLDAACFFGDDGDEVRGAYLQCMIDGQGLELSNDDDDVCSFFQNNFCPYLSCSPEGPCRGATMNYFECVTEEFSKYDPDQDACNLSCDSHGPLSTGSNKSGANITGPLYWIMVMLSMSIGGGMV